MKRSATIATIATTVALAISGVLVSVAAPASAVEPAANTKKAISLAEVRKHNKPTDCWAVINKKVYNLTKWVSQHPGGAGAIGRLCGTDGTKAFTGKHGGQGAPTSQLAKYQIGVLR